MYRLTSMKMKQTKSWLLCGAAMIAGLMGLVTEASAEDKFYLPDFEISAGESKQLAIQFESERVNDYVAFQFDLYLPDGLSVEQNNKGKYNFTFNTERNDDHTFSSSDREDGAIRVLAASLTNACFWEESGDFVYFTITATDDFSGTHEIYLKSVMFSTVDSRTDLPDVKTIVTGPSADSGNEANINITTANQWATCILPFSTELPSGVQAYSGEGVNGEYLILKEETSIKANTPYLLYAENGYEGKVTGNAEAAEGTTVTTGVLSGALAEQDITSGYVLQNQGSGCIFYKVSSEITIPAGKCWLNVTGNRNAIRIQPGTTGINAVEGACATGKTYTLDGKVVDQPQSGKVYVVNGKKVMKL